MRKKNLTISERILVIEKKLKQILPGTQIGRILTKGGMQWRLSIGDFPASKAFFVSETIEGCLEQAEETYKINKKG
jgi:hypothetical protein